MGSLGGIRSVAPQFALLFLIILLGSVALPLTNGFVGEFLLINGIFQYNFWMAVVAGSTVILGAVYMLRSYQAMMLGETKPITEGFADLNTTEKTVLYTIAALVIIFGVYPKPLLDIVNPAVEELIKVFQTGLLGE
jgi:NADH-quinone oxidoreductase subunit M